MKTLSRSLYLIAAGILSTADMPGSAPPSVETRFSKITTGAAVEDRNSSGDGAWGDYDGDGDLDLFVANGTFGGTLENNRLYRNDGNGKFTDATPASMGSELVDSVGGAWGDFNNDGLPDLFVSNKLKGNDLVYRNESGGFNKVVDSPVVTDGQFAAYGAWADYDRDGALDLFVTQATQAEPVNRLYRNNGDGTLSRVTDDAVSNDDGGGSTGLTWGDYDNDGWIDLFVCRYGAANSLFRNIGGKGFARIDASPVGNDRGTSIGAAWADYDNDGWFDLFVVNGGPDASSSTFNVLYHNNGDGTFTKNTTDIVVRDRGAWANCAWGDYDNDGFIDLFVANQISTNALYHNNGDGTFVKVAGVVPVSEGESFGCAWGDYDNDGFLDLFVANGWSASPRENYLYRNEGNSNSWLKVKLAGSQSNASGIGARIRVTATLRGREVRQLRQISGGSGGQSTLLAHFGLGDAAQVTALTVEWPSGTVQEFRNLPVNRMLSISEPPRLDFERTPGAERGAISMRLTGVIGEQYVIETSSDLKGWSPWLTAKTSSRSTLVGSRPLNERQQEFFRATARPTATTP